MRAGEVASLRLEDIDWKAAEVSVAGKGSQGRLPVPNDVGEAIVDYLEHGRPSCESRKVFLSVIAPFGGISVPTISCIVRGALERAGVQSPSLRGAHLLRHSLATSLLRRGATLSEISQILRHQNPDTTAIYAKVDIDTLRSVAEPWKGGRP